MRTITVCTLTLGLLSSSLAFASQGPAATPGAPAAAPTPAPTSAPSSAAPTTKAAPLAKHTAKVSPKIVTVSGEVTHVDLAKKLLTLKEASAVANFEILPSTQVTLADGKSGHESDVKVGEHVTVTYNAHGKTLVAKSVKIG